MIGAIITLGIGALGTSIIALVMFMDIRDAERRCADARVDASNKAGALAIAIADVATQKNRADAEKARANALDDELAKVEAAAGGERLGAMDRLLSAWRASHVNTDPAAGPGPRAVPATLASVPAGPGVDPLASRT